MKFREIDNRLEFKKNGVPSYNMKNVDALEKEMIAFSKIFGSMISKTRTLMDI